MSLKQKRPREHGQCCRLPGNYYRQDATDGTFFGEQIDGSLFCRAFCERCPNSFRASRQTIEKWLKAVSTGDLTNKKIQPLVCGHCGGGNEGRAAKLTLGQKNKKNHMLAAF